MFVCPTSSAGESRNTTAQQRPSLKTEGGGREPFLNLNIHALVIKLHKVRCGQHIHQIMFLKRLTLKQKLKQKIPYL